MIHNHAQKMTDKLSHLTDNEVNQLIEEYYAGIRIAGLISKYNIDVLPGQLVKTFPLKKLDTVCIHCGSIMVQEYLSKSAHYDAAATCLNCGHNESGRCNCPKCREAAKQAIEEEKARQEALRQQMREQLKTVLRCIVPQSYGWGHS